MGDGGLAGSCAEKRIETKEYYVSAIIIPALENYTVSGTTNYDRQRGHRMIRSGVGWQFQVHNQGLEIVSNKSIVGVIEEWGMEICIVIRGFAISRSFLFKISSLQLNFPRDNIEVEI